MLLKYYGFTPGSLITLADGVGIITRLCWKDISATRVAFQITSTTHTPKRDFYPSGHCAHQKYRPNRMAVEKCTEIGVDSITPLLCKTSEWKVVTDRLEKVIISAFKAIHAAV